MHTLSSAALAVRRSKSAIYRAIKTGRLNAHKLKSGTYAIWPGELLRVFPSNSSKIQHKIVRFPVWDVS